MSSSFAVAEDWLLLDIRLFVLLSEIVTLIWTSYEASYPYIPFHISCLQKNKQGCKDVYCILYLYCFICSRRRVADVRFWMNCLVLLNSEVQSPTAISIWNTVFENDLSDWKSIFTALNYIYWYVNLYTKNVHYTCYWKENIRVPKINLWI